MAKPLHMWLTSRVFNYRTPICQNSRHNRVLCTGYALLIEKDLGVDAFLKAEIFSELENRLEVNLDEAAFHTSTTPIKLAHAIFDALRREDREDALRIFREGYREACQLPVANITLGKSLYFDLGLDSISMMEIAEAIEERYCLSIDIQEFCRREKVDSVVNYLKQLIKNA